ncbi:MAG: L,D-transpeptidase family protein [Rhodospirillaceae bacterium]|nr:L,D-transpeptidase family protein [Rhodospirillaceae bacterium]
MREGRSLPAAAGAVLLACALVLTAGAARGEAYAPPPGGAAAPPVALAAAPVESPFTAALRQRLAEGGAGPFDAEALGAFYRARGFAPLWVGAGGLTGDGRILLQALRAAGRAGAPPGLPGIEDAASQAAPPALAELELRLDAALAAGAAAARAALREPETAAGPSVDAAVLAEAATETGDGLPGWLAANLPADPAFWRLAQAVERYRAIVAQGGWPALPLGPKLTPGAHDPRVLVLRRRLAVSGDAVDAPAEDPELYDTALVGAVKGFQARHGLAVDGVVGTKTVEALNVDAPTRLAQLRRSLERVSRDPHPIDERYIFVNIAGATLEVHEGGRVIYRDRVVVGRVDRQTPELKSVIDRVVINPFWYVPASIARKDLVVRGQKDSAYFSRLNIRIYSSETANEIDPATIDWFSPQAQALRFRQDPGPENALGPVKFDFDNPYAVYLHGTAHQELFDKPARFFGSGCVRVERPLDFAAVILAGNPRYGRSALDHLVAAGRTLYVAVPRLWPLHIAYLTAWVDDPGTVQFRPDVYGRDAPLRPPQIAGRRNK